MRHCPKPKLKGFSLLRARVRVCTEKLPKTTLEFSKAPDSIISASFRFAIEIYLHVNFRYALALIIASYADRPANLF